MKKIILFSLLSLTLFSNSTTDSEKSDLVKNNEEVFRSPKNKKPFFKLTSDVLKLLDGIPGCLDGNAIVDMFSIKKYIRNLELGIIDTTIRGAKPIKLIYNNKHCTLEELIKHEEHLNKNANVPHRKERLEDLDKCLKQGKSSFIKATVHFMDKIRGAKGLVMTLIHEFKDKRNLKDTLLTEWANTNGNEGSVFDAKIKTMKEFCTFLTHVNDLLGIFIFSCDQGFAQFKMKQNAAKK